MSRLAAVVLLAIALIGATARVTPGQATHPISGRPIANVMGYEAAAWLERPEREAEEAPIKAVAALRLRPGHVVADIGAGSGYYTMLLGATVGPCGRVYATDIQPEMLTLIQKKIQARRVADVEFVLGTPTGTRLPDSSVDSR
jgi:predicted methyltransferase